MAKEILAVPEDHLADVITILEAGMQAARDQQLPIDPEVFVQLSRWCADEKAYLEG